MTSRALLQVLTATFWDSLVVSSDVNANVDCLYNALNRVFSCFVPVIKVKNSFNFPIWFSADLKSNVLQKRSAHAKYKQS